jgi:hypothetical protein
MCVAGCTCICMIHSDLCIFEDKTWRCLYLYATSVQGLYKMKVFMMKISKPPHLHIRAPGFVASPLLHSHGLIAVTVMITLFRPQKKNERPIPSEPFPNAQIVAQCQKMEPRSQPRSRSRSLSQERSQLLCML